MHHVDAINIEELRGIAKRRLPRFAFDYLDGGAEDEFTLRRNREAFQHLRWRWKTLVDVSRRTLATRLLGAPSALPVVVGPTALNGLFWPDGDLEIARAAAAAGVPFTMSTVSMSLVEDIAREAQGRLWLQAYVFRERAITDAIMRRALDAGFECVVLTSDFPVPGKRERDWRSGLLPQQRFTAATWLDILMHPRWVAAIGRHRPRFVNVERELPFGHNVNAYVGHNMFDPSFDWDDVKRFRDVWPRKMLLKGVLRVDDAERAVAIGLDGIVLSNHGGRQLDGAVAGIEVLPEVARAVGGRASILVDGGIRRGGDIAKALALGAEGVHLGRATTYGLAAGGSAGAARALEILADELDRTLALTGCPDVAALSPDLLVRT
ncbi:MAG: alpha-hydroxy-acid oxidizing protein [Gammaproteobacteria bacterium]|nr:alpha-hydroxy-acid oxidizing protein [Gammaproteobacteria bacterium]